MDMTPRDGTGLQDPGGGVGSGAGGTSQKKHNLSLFGCLECVRHSVYHRADSAYQHHVEKEEHDTLHEVAHGLHFASVALLGFLVVEVSVPSPRRRPRAGDREVFSVCSCKGDGFLGSQRTNYLRNRLQIQIVTD